MCSWFAKILVKIGRFLYRLRLRRGIPRTVTSGARGEGRVNLLLAQVVVGPAAGRAHPLFCCR